MSAKRTVVRGRAPEVVKLLESCRLCGHNCRVNRAKGETGFCGAGSQVFVSSFTAHHGEEPVFSGTRGSGTIFFAFCNLRCRYCQNYDISQLHMGEEVSIEDLSRMMLELERRGCHNINLVSPTHYMPRIMEALDVAISRG